MCTVQTTTAVQQAALHRAAPRRPPAASMPAPRAHHQRPAQAASQLLVPATSLIKVQS